MNILIDREKISKKYGKSVSVWMRWMVRILSVSGLVIGFWGYMLTDILVHDVANPNTYIEVLYEQNVYTRIHTEILADPEFEQGFVELMRLLGLEETGQGLYSLSTSTLYLVMPPAAIQSATESFIYDLVGYLNGTSDRIDPRIELTSIFEITRLQERLTVAIEQIFRNQVRSEHPDYSDTDVSREVYKLARELTGQVPAVTTSIRSVEGLSATQISNLAAILLRPVSDETEVQLLQVEGALVGDDLSGALTLVARYLIAEKLSSVMVPFVSELQASGSIQIFEVVAANFEITTQEVISGLNTIRDWIAEARQIWLPIFGLLIIGSLGGLLFSVREWGLVRQVRMLGFVLTSIGLLSLAIWLLARIGLMLFLQDTFVDAGSVIPESLNRLIQDVIYNLLLIWWRSGLRMIMVLGIVGIVMVGMSFYVMLHQQILETIKPLAQQRRAALVSLILILLVAVPLLRGVFRMLERPTLPCNGSVELCERHVNEVTFATTHNSMSIAEYGWLWPSHDGDITDQLDYGVRGLLIDTHYFDATASATSYFPDATDQQLAVVNQAINRVGLEEREGTYVCHILCHLGWTPLVDTLTEIREFMDTHPREILVIVIEDKISVVDTELAFAQSGLDEYLYTHRTGEVWPTLERMILQNQRVIVMAEEEGPPPKWYLHAWDYVEETPYSFSDPDEFSCEQNRGGDDKPFFLLNHWIERVSPSRVDANRVNSYAALSSRVEQCRQERGQIPNLVAVNFYQIGDLMRVVNDLNGVGE